MGFFNNMADKIIEAGHKERERRQAEKEKGENRLDCQAILSATSKSLYGITWTRATRNHTSHTKKWIIPRLEAGKAC